MNLFPLKKVQKKTINESMRLTAKDLIQLGIVKYITTTFIEKISSKMSVQVICLNSSQMPFLRYFQIVLTLYANQKRNIPMIFRPKKAECSSKIQNTENHVPVILDIYVYKYTFFTKHFC